MLAYKLDGSWTAWRPGSRLPSGMSPPPNAAEIMSPKELAKLGLSLVTVEAVPDGYHATGWTLVEVKGAPVSQPAIQAIIPPTSDELAAQVSPILASKDTLELALRAVISLLADKMAVTDAQAKTAVQNRMKAIAEGTRG